MALFESLDDSTPIHPALCIPPLHDPFPEGSITARLPPLEPTARVSANVVDGEAAKLTGRRKALAEAKSIGEGELNELWPIQQKPTKRKPKLYEHERIADFVQLPKPKGKAKEAKPPPFQPISEINKLHEPPPSAAIFPPITPNDKNGQEHRRLSSLSPIIHAQLEEHIISNEKKMRRRTSNGPPAKRLYLRNRTMWTDEETEYLARGVAMYGIGKWKKILNHPGFKFQQGRTYVDLKDRFRTKYGGKVSNIPDRISAVEGLPPLVSRPPRVKTENPSKKGKAKKGTERKGAWSEAEDNALIVGYEKHGFSWARIAKDPSLTFNNRSGPQIRDRFRQLFPTSYGEGRVMKVRPNERAQDLNTSISVPTTLNMASPLTTRDPTGSHMTANVGLALSETEHHGAMNIVYNQKTEDTASKLQSQPSACNAITGLLNDTLDETQPSSSLRIEEDWGHGVTLPPLMWEEMATRPLFDFDG